MRTTSTIEVEGTTLKLSNLDKVLYPEPGFTKGQVLDYYIRAADVLLPHLHNRPITLKRYPDGITAQHFYEKNAPKFTPPWIETFHVPRKTGGADIRYILINDLRTLVWCTNLANLELHPFLHTAPHIDCPNSIVFDLDPGEGSDVLTCIQVAFWLKDALEEQGLQSWPKVSGSKGLQIYIPLNHPDVTYDITQPFALAMAQRLEREHPDCVVSEMPKHLRKGKVFIDWSQNSDFKTTVGVYSLRAKRAEPYVSMPVTWDELRRAAKKKDATPLYFSPEAALARMKKKGDLFEPVLHTHQSITPGKPLDFIEPMQAQAVESLPDAEGWLYEVKFDGYRAEAIRNGDGVRLLSRNNNALNDRFPPIAKALAQIPEGTILDGEVVALDPQGRPSFHLLQNYNGRTPLHYYVFDLLAWRGDVLVQRPLSARRKLLEEIELAPPLYLSATIEAELDDLIHAAREQGLEGLVAKRANSLYEPGKRTGAWRKLRINKGQELVVGGYKPGNNGFEYLLVGYYDNRKLIFIAKLKNGFTPHTRREVAARFDGLETDTCPFTNLPEPKNARRGEAITKDVMPKLRWLKPKLVVETEFVDWTDANHLRHAKYKGLRDDKPATQVRKEIRPQGGRPD